MFTSLFPKVVMELDLTTGGFDFVSDSAASKVPLMVPAQNSRTARFPIVPRQLGHIPLKVTAHSRVESDSVIRMLLVEVINVLMYCRKINIWNFSFEIDHFCLFEYSPKELNKCIQEVCLLLKKETKR